MKLMTKKIVAAAQKQYPLGAEMDGQMIVAKFFHPFSSFYWYLMNQDPEDPDYLWGIVKGHEVECGSFSLSELEGTKIHGLGMERDLHFKPILAKDVYEKLNKGVHV